MHAVIESPAQKVRRLPQVALKNIYQWKEANYLIQTVWGEGTLTYIQLKWRVHQCIGTQMQYTIQTQSGQLHLSAISCSTWWSYPTFHSNLCALDHLQQGKSSVVAKFG